jgi:putative Mn2+ efflux pump MntP
MVAIGLSMDAFAVAVCKGLTMGKMNVKKGAIIALYFGTFQAIMPVIGYFLASSFSRHIDFIDHYVAFFLLSIIGVKMIRDSFVYDLDDTCTAGDSLSVSFKTMLPLAVATSIDALAVGITFSFLCVKIVPAVSLIAAVTFVLCFLGVKIGSMFGGRIKKKAELLGGVVLIAIGFKILLEHIGIIIT